MNRRLKYFVVSISTVLMAFLLVGAVIGRSASPDEPYPHLTVYAEVLSRIKSEYVEEPDIKSVTLGAVNGMLEAIDPFASYLNPEQYKQYTKAEGTHKANVGLILSKKFGYVGVVDVIPGSAAAHAGLSTGDMIEGINGIATRDMPLAYANLLLAGEPNTSVELSVLRIKNPDPQKLNLTRTPVKFPAVTSKMLQDQIGLIEVASLDAGKTKEVQSAVNQLEKQGAKKLILDLRNDGTGKPEEGVALADLFMDKGLLAYVQGQKFERKDYNATAEHTASKLPMVILTNRGTASGAEVAAAALVDSKRAEVIGERTYGDASLRRAITMDDGSAVILSVAKFYSPSGKSIQDNGVTPGIMVTDFDAAAAVEDEEDENAAPAPETEKKDKADDPVLKRAIEYFAQGGTQTAQNTDQPGSAESERPAVTPKNPLLKQ